MAAGSAYVLIRYFSRFARTDGGTGSSHLIRGWVRQFRLSGLRDEGPVDGTSGDTFFVLQPL